MRLRVSIVGGSGYVGGELARLLLAHPDIELVQITSERLVGRPIASSHPNLRGTTRLQFVSVKQIEPCDVIFLAMAHGEAAKQIEHYAALAPRIVDCSADFRLNDAETYTRWYGEAHPAPEWLGRFVYGLPEVYREQIRSASYVSGVGCNATATNFAVLPLVRAGLLDVQRDVVVEVKVGSSEGGAQSSDSSHHPERSGVVRSFSPTGHRHTAEVQMITGLQRVHLSITSVELVRGALATAHLFPS
ncbi:MAG: N-acetyl-gamma-glutamyl-phosphate reductase, partial [Chloroflexaceae bacterium]|nr:N-acetyl-gamma-glutamyl-phosphate reductase [Chloroflexaceae bacterium]